MDAVSDECYRVEDLGEVNAAIRQGRRPEHLDACPRCRALLASYSAFLVPPDLPERGQLEDVARRVEIPGAAGATRTIPTPDEARPGILHRARRLLELPWLRPVAAVGLVGLAVIVIVGIRQDGIRPTPSHVLRGATPEAGATVQLLPPFAVVGGGAIFSWRTVPGVDSYALVFYRADLTELGRREMAGDTTLFVPPDEMATLQSRGPLYWQVVAKRSNAEFLRSAPRELVLPKAAGG